MSFVMGFSYEAEGVGYSGNLTIPANIQMAFQRIAGEDEVPQPVEDRLYYFYFIFER